MNLSRHFTLEELTRSEYAIRNGIDNTPPDWAASNLLLLCSRILEPIRDLFNTPVTINSGYRCPAVNLGIGGAVASDHCRGLAADFEIRGVTTTEIVARLAATNLHFGQLIDEFPPLGWVHISYDPAAKRQVLRATKARGRTVYSQFPLPN